jgi:phage terminase large subunit GpA-like protein
MSAIADTASELLADLWRSTVPVILPQPPAPPHVEYARTLVLPDGRRKGDHYNPATHPPQMAVLRALDAGYRRVYLAKPVQDGGTLVALIPLFRRAIACNQTVVLAYPTMDSAKDIWTTKIMPVLVAKGGQEPESGGGSKGGAPRVVTLPGGGRFILRGAGGKGESGQASVTGDVVCVDEVDDWTDLHRIVLVEQRIEESADPLYLRICTVKQNPSLILMSLEEGTNSRLHYACPHCGHYQPLEWKNVTYVPNEQVCVAGTAVIVCTHCACTWNEEDRQKALSGEALVVHKGQSIEHETVDGIAVSARVIGPVPETPIFSLRWTRIESPRHSLHKLCSAHASATWAAARGNYGPMKSFVQDYLTEVYEEPAAVGEITNAGLSAISARATYDKRICPQWVHSIIVAVDVQGDRHYWLAMGFGDDDRAAIIDWGYEQLVPSTDPIPDRTPTPADRRRTNERIDALRREGWQIEGTQNRMPAVAVGIDVGYAADELVPWIAGHPDWYAVNGCGKDTLQTRGAKRIKLDVILSSWLDVTQPEGWPIRLHKINSHNVHTEVHAGLLRSPESPAAIWLPRGLAKNDVLCLHLSGEIWDTTGDKPYWREVRKRHDFLDCAKYARALGRLYQFTRLITTPTTQDTADDYAATAGIHDY